MSSIEKFVDRLMGNGPGRTEQGGAVPESSGTTISTTRQSGVTAEQSFTNVTRQAQADDTAAIDLERMQAAGMLTPGNTRSLIAEEYRAIKRPLLKNAFGSRAAPVEHPNLIMVTSSLPGEGKSFTAVNLAMSIAMEMDHTVLLVEADVAKPATARYLGLMNSEPRGLVDYLADDKLSLEELLIRTNVPKLTLLRAGRSHPHATELLASQSMRRLTQELSQRYSDRVVILDSPPLLLSSEAVVLSGLVGQVVMVVESGMTPQRAVKDALSLLGPDKIIGIVLNKSRGGSSQGYGYGYYGPSGYGRD